MKKYVGIKAKRPMSDIEMLVEKKN